jgi:hypothetical protein
MDKCPKCGSSLALSTDEQGLYGRCPLVGCEYSTRDVGWDNENEKLFCTASSYLRRPCPYNGVPTTECRASLPYEDGTCLFYHPDRQGVTGGTVK